MGHDVIYLTSLHTKLLKKHFYVLKFYILQKKKNKKT